MTHDAKPKQAWAVKMDELVNKYGLDNWKIAKARTCFADGYKTCRAEMQIELDKRDSAIEKMQKALITSAELCLCTRNTFGFDYSETHPELGNPKPGSRWLTPNDIIKSALAQIKKIMGEV